MSRFEVPQPILNSPYEEPAQHWFLEEGREPKLRDGRRKAIYYYRPARATAESVNDEAGTAVELELVTRVRERLKKWRDVQWPGTTRTTRELLEFWGREGRKHRLFFAQLEAAETIIFLTEARADFVQGVEVPWDELGDDRRADGYLAFRRYACKMATGSGKTTVMGMVAAWSILNKVHNRSDARFSDVVLALCPNVTIRERLGELDPRRGEASLYRTRDLVPTHLMADLAQGRVVITNWHTFQPRELQVSGVSARVTRLGKPERKEETVHIGPKTTKARGTRYMTIEDLQQQIDGKRVTVIAQENDEQGNLRRVRTERYEYRESDAKIIERVVGREVGGKQNLLVLNDEAHHAYRIRKTPSEDLGEGEEDDSEFDDVMDEEATVWVDGLDKIHKLRGINFCVDLSATPYYLSTVGADANRPFPWVVSDFGLVDAIESGLVKIPQFAVRDTTGAEVPGYFNIWQWIIPQLTTAERGGTRGSPKPEAVLKWAHMPIAMICGLWRDTFEDWQSHGERRPPVLIVVCKNTKIAKVVFDWLADGKGPPNIPPLRMPELRNSEDLIRSIRVDTKVVHETDGDEAKSDESAWMRFQLDTVGKLDWPRDSQGRALYPENFEELAKKLQRPLHPPGREVRCIVSVGMLTEGWDCNTVTHIIGLRPFMSQLLCEQVVGRGLRRQSYAVDANDRMTEEVAKILGVPFLVIPTKENEGGIGPTPPKRTQICALPERASAYEITFPRVEGYTQAIRNRIRIEWASVPKLVLDPAHIPPEIEMKGLLPTNKGRHSLLGPGKLINVTLSPYRSGMRLQELVFSMARDLTRDYARRPSCTVPVHQLFGQFVEHAREYLEHKVEPIAPAQRVDVFLSPYYGWAIERLVEAVQPDTSAGEAAELPRYEVSRGPGSTADVDFWTGRDVRQTTKSHVNYVVADTHALEQRVGNVLDKHAHVDAFVKNAGLGFAVPYIHNGQARDYLPDFIVRVRVGSGGKRTHLILETKGYDPLEEIKAEAARRWASAVNAEGTYGYWEYAIVRKPEEVEPILARVAGAQ